MPALLLALLPAVLIGIVQLCLGGLTSTLREKLAGLCWGGLIAALISIPLLHPQFTLRGVVVSLISGVLVAWGVRDQTRAMQAIGVSRAIPISTAAQLIIVSLGGVILMGEWHGRGALPVGLCAVALLVVGVWFTSRTEVTAMADGGAHLPREAAAGSGLGSYGGAGRALGDREEQHAGLAADSEEAAGGRVALLTRKSELLDAGEGFGGVDGCDGFGAGALEQTAAQREAESAADWALGVRLLITSTIGLSGYLLLVQVNGVAGKDAIVPQAIAWSIAACLLTAPRGAGVARLVPPATPAFVKHVGVGVLWGAGSLLTQVASDAVGVATAFTASQLCVVISAVGGIVILGESRSRRELCWTLAGLALILMGAILVGIAKMLDAGM